MSSISLESILTQLFQPYFYYSVILLTISAVCIKILLRHYHFLGRRAKSIIYLIPLIIPVVVMSFFHPEVTARMVSSVKSTVKSNGGKFAFVTIFSTETLSITGILCLIGLTLGTAFFITVIFFGDKIAGENLDTLAMAVQGIVDSFYEQKGEGYFIGSPIKVSNLIN